MCGLFKHFFNFKTVVQREKEIRVKAILSVLTDKLFDELHNTVYKVIKGENCFYIIYLDKPIVAFNFVMRSDEWALVADTFTQYPCMDMETKWFDYCCDFDEVNKEVLDIFEKAKKLISDNPEFKSISSYIEMALNGNEKREIPTDDGVITIGKIETGTPTPFIPFSYKDKEGLISVVKNGTRLDFFFHMAYRDKENRLIPGGLSFMETFYFLPYITEEMCKQYFIPFLRKNIVLLYDASKKINHLGTKNILRVDSNILDAISDGSILL